MKLLITAMMMTLVGCSNLYSYKEPTNKKHHEIVQLIGLNGGTGSCSAFVISDSLALTAGHCVVRNDQCKKGRCPFEKGAIIIANSKGQDTGVRAFVVTAKSEYNPAIDYAVLKGNFKDFNKLPVHSYNYPVDEGDELAVCGYAHGRRPPTCTYGKYLGAKGFVGMHNAFMVQGMSGGPVVNVYGIAIGINSSRHIDLDISFFNPTLGLIQTRSKKK